MRIPQLYQDEGVNAIAMDSVGMAANNVVKVNSEPYRLLILESRHPLVLPRMIEAVTDFLGANDAPWGLHFAYGGSSGLHSAHAWYQGPALEWALVVVPENSSVATERMSQRAGEISLDGFEVVKAKSYPLAPRKIAPPSWDQDETMVLISYRPKSDLPDIPF